MGGDEFAAAAAEAKGDTRYLEALGARFELDPVGPDAIDWLELAANSDASPHSKAGGGSFLTFAKACFTDESWPRFRAAVKAAKITYHRDLEDLIGQSLEVITGRPTTPSSPSDAGSSSTSPASTEPSSDPTPGAAES